MNSASSFDSGAFGTGLAWSAGAVLVVLAITFVFGKRLGRHNVVDTAWGLLFCAVAVATFFVSSGHGDPLRRVLLLALPLAWGVRLAQHVGRRSAGKGEDPRYKEMLEKKRGNPDLVALRMVYLLQGVLALVIAAPILVGGYAPSSVGVVAWIGVVVWLVGVFFEAVGDAQMERFRSDPANKGKLIQNGLWRYTRHPNYFGDACVWWGIFLVAADGWPGVLSFVGPIVMTLLLTIGSGARILEKSMSKREGWDEYAAKTSMFFPLPPQVKRAATSG